MKFKVFNLISILLTGMILATSCTETIDSSARYVFKERTIAGYLSEHQQFSEYVRLLKEQKVSEISETSVYQLMTAYGAYTCFAPTNDAIQLYLDSLCIKGIIPEPSWDAFPNERLLDSIRYVIVMNSLLDGKDADRKTFSVSEFPDNNEEFSLNTMADCKISAMYDRNDPDSCLIDGICPVSRTNRDIECLNGYIHELGYTINPTNETLGSTMHLYASQPDCGYYVMAKLIVACGLTDTLSAVKDYEYEKLVKIGAITESWWNNIGTYVQPQPRRKYGFTLFAETDDFWTATLKKDLQDITIDDVRQWVASKGFYPDAVNDENYKDVNNLLNQFVTYHLLPCRLTVDKLVLHYNEKGFNPKGRNKTPTIPVWSHYVTMGKRRLLRLWESAESKGVYLNRFPVLDNSRRGTYHEVSCTEENEGLYIRTDVDSKLVKLQNSIIYPIDKVLVYDSHVRQELMRTRLRYDFWDFAPEMMSNDMRVMSYFMRYSFPPDEVYQYFNDINVNTKDMTFYLLNGINQDWPNYQADEVLCEGIYDITFRLPPVPMTGTYEIRMGVSTESPWRGICQVYFGENKDALYPAGIPVNMALGGTDPLLRWEMDSQDDDYNAEVDKRMRNNGFMKGPEYFTEVPGASQTGRSLAKTTRRILLRTTIDADKVYYMRFKSVQDQKDKQLFLDYIEWCPKEIYDNPNTPEDIW